MTDWHAVAAHIARVTDTPFSPAPPSSVGGGCINTSVRLSDETRSYFVKTNDAGRLAMFEAEADRYAFAFLDISDPENPLYAEHNARQTMNPGSVGKILVALALLDALLDAALDPLLDAALDPLRPRPLFPFLQDWMFVHHVLLEYSLEQLN